MNPSGAIMLEIIREITCYNQGELAQYGYVGSRLHQKMKDLIRTSHKPNVDEILNAVISLEEYLTNTLENLVLKNFAYATTYYNYGGTPPRVCLKGLKDGHIITLIRSAEVSYKSEESSDTNSGFHFIKETGNFFICNDIPATVKDGMYRNNRIDRKRAFQYASLPFRLFFERFCPFVLDSYWKDCWKDVDGSMKDIDYYKSTMVIPLTLWNNDLSQFFLDFNGPDYEPYIYAYLCFDHPTINYFQEEDINFSYILADWLSLFFMTNHNFLAGSATYRKALELI